MGDLPKGGEKAVGGLTRGGEEQRRCSLADEVHRSCKDCAGGLTGSG
jgi:hypothetical protein